jgi:hypothetical protein
LSPQDRARGASQFEANIDSTVVLKKLDKDDDNSAVEVWRKKNKDGPQGLRLYVQRRNLANSCVLEEVDAPASAKRGTAREDALRDSVRSVLCSTDPFTLTREQVIEKVGGDKTKLRRVMDNLLAQSIVVEEHRRRPEGKRQVARDVLAWNTIERVRVPLGQSNRDHGAVAATPPKVASGVSGVAGDDHP